MSDFRTKPLAIVIPVKVDFLGLRTTLDSICKNDRIAQDVEFAVVDAGSCQETCDWLLQQDHRIEHIRSAKDNGVYDAMNYGKKTINASWVWFLGAGDLPDTEGLCSLLDEIQTWDSSDVHVYGVNISKPEAGVPSFYPARWDQSMVWRNTTHHQGVFYPSRLIKANSFNPDHRVLADYGLHLSLFQKGVRAQLHPAIICTVESGGISRKFDARLYREEWAIKKDLLRGVVKWAHPFWLILKYCFKKTS